MLLSPGSEISLPSSHLKNHELSSSLYELVIIYLFNVGIWLYMFDQISKLCVYAQKHITVFELTMDYYFFWNDLQNSDFVAYVKFYRWIHTFFFFIYHHPTIPEYLLPPVSTQLHACNIERNGVDLI